MSLCRGEDSLFTQLESYYYFKDQRFIIQPKVKGVREYRLFFIDNDIVGAFEKRLKNKDEFRKNAERSHCIPITPKDLSPKLTSFFHMIKRNTNLFYGGIDILETDKELFLLEVNPCPGFETLEQVCEVNIAKELVNRIHQSFVN
jgi:ribosomal protein S6--L-glutamate ligase